MFDQYGRATGYNQIAPGRDVEEFEEPGKPGRPRKNPQQQTINNAIVGNPPQAVFRGAEQTIGATQPQPQVYQPSAIDNLFGGNTGVAGGKERQIQPSQQPLGQFANRLEGFDAEKLQSAHDSPKYIVGRIASRHDLSKGLTQEFLDELRAAGLADDVIGQVGGDKIEFVGNVDPRFQGVTKFDILRDLESGQGNVQWVGLNGPAAPQGGGRTALPMQQAILGSIPTVTAPQGDALWKQIMAALQVDPTLASLAKLYR